MFGFFEHSVRLGRRRGRVAWAAVVLAGLVSLVVIPVTHAAEPVLVLAFGLDDDTLLPDVADEHARVDALAPFVRRSLGSFGYASPALETPLEMRPLIANGYLVRFPEAIAQLARDRGARWIAIGKLRKFSFMESWIRAYLIDADSGKVVGQAEAEVRGHMTDTRMTQRTAHSLAEQLHDFILALKARERNAGSLQGGAS